MVADVAIREEINQYENQRNKPTPSLNHSFIQANLIAELKVNYKKKYTTLSEISLQLPNVKVSVPDVAIYPKLVIDYKQDVIKMTDPPLSVIEILSPKQHLNDILNKFSTIYFPAGVKSAWLIIPPLQYVAIYQPNMEFTTFLEEEVIDEAIGVVIKRSDIFVG